MTTPPGSPRSQETARRLGYGIVAACLAVALVCWKFSPVWRWVQYDRNLAAPPSKPAGAPGTWFALTKPPTLLSPIPFVVAPPVGAPEPLEVEFTMPSMRMPTNIVPLKKVAEGRYSGTVTLTMTGDWVAILRAGSPAREIGRAPFNVP